MTHKGTKKFQLTIGHLQKSRLKIGHLQKYQLAIGHHEKYQLAIGTWQQYQFPIGTWQQYQLKIGGCRQSIIKSNCNITKSKKNLPAQSIICGSTCTERCTIIEIRPIIEIGRELKSQQMMKQIRKAETKTHIQIIKSIHCRSNIRG
jgi:hypothetical protein